MEIHTEGLNGSIEFRPTSDNDWMDCEVAIRVPGFQANYVCWVYRLDLRSLHDELLDLYEKREGVCDWRAMEGGVGLNLELNLKGHLLGRYEFRGRSDGPKLIGSFRADQTHLPMWAELISAALSE